MGESNPRLVAALGYAGRGRLVLPLHHAQKDGNCSCNKPDCDSIGKHPRTRHGLVDATTEPAVIRGWWAKWPDANAAVVTGPTSGIWVLGPDGPEGLADLDRLVEEHGALPQTARVRSGSGGEHLLFRWPADGKPIPNRRNHRGTKIDVRGCGDGPGYVVAPPSRNANGEYVWIDEIEPADSPPWLLNWVRGITLKVKASKPRPSVIERAISYILKCPPAISGQNGHGMTFAVARALCWGFNLPPDVALDLLQTHYSPRCAPPLNERELQHKVADAANKDYGKPRGYLLVDDPLERGNTGDSRDASGETAISAAGWGPPAALPTMPAVPAFPLNVFPHRVANYWRAAGEALACPTDYISVPGMTLLGAAVGRARAAQVKPGYAESPLFWSAVFAPPGGTKSPALRAARGPLQRAEVRWLDEHKDRMKVFDTDMDRHAAKVKEWKANGCAGEPPEKPGKPTLRQATLDDTTTEATAKVLGENPRGVAVIKDELIGFVRGQNQYKSGRGSDREFWLSAWAGAPAKVNRSKDHDAGPLVIPHPFVAITGMMCPDALGELRGENRNGDAQADGFLDRFLLSFPDPLDASPETWRVIPEDVEQGYCEVFLDVLAMEMVPEVEGLAVARHRPYFVRFAADGRAAWEEFTGNIAHRMNALDKFDPFRGVLSKLRGYGLRFAALLWSLRRACGELDPEEPISAEIMAGASILVDYFERHAARCLGRGWADRPMRIATRLLAWLSRNPERVGFNRTEAFIALKDKRDVKSSESLNPAFRLLVDHGYLRPLDRPENIRPGPTPEAYHVNPAWNRATSGSRV